MLFSIALLAAMRSAVVPSVSLKPSARCSLTKLSKLALRSRTVMRSGVITSCCDDASADSMRSSERIAKILPGGETRDFGIGGMGDKGGRRGAHLQQPVLEIVAGAGDLGLGLHALEGAADLQISGLEGGGIGQKSDERNETKRDDASAHRQPGEE